MKKNSVHQFTVKDIEGNDFDFSDLKGEKVLVVNTASKCGFTSQYDGLENLYREYKEAGLTIVGFPTNDFGGQEPGSEEEIAAFCKENYGVTFPMMSKIKIIGEGEHPLYEFLTEKEKNGVMDSTVKWNFQKYGLNKEGELEKVFYSKTSPDSEEIISWVEE